MGLSVRSGFLGFFFMLSTLSLLAQGDLIEVFWATPFQHQDTTLTQRCRSYRTFQLSSTDMAQYLTGKASARLRYSFTAEDAWELALSSSNLTCPGFQLQLYTMEGVKTVIRHKDFQFGFVVIEGSFVFNQWVFTAAAFDNIKLDGYPRANDSVEIAPFVVFPNPTSKGWFVSFNRPLSTTIYYTLRDLLGRDVRQGLLTNHTIPEDDVSSGVYLLQLFAEGKAVGVSKSSNNKMKYLIQKARIAATIPHESTDF